MRRVLVVVALAALPLPAAPAFAHPDPTYPVRSFTSWTGNTTRDATDPDLGRYQFEQGLYGAARRAFQRYPERYGPGMDVEREAQRIVDGVGHNRPVAPYAQWGDVGHPDLMPDWDHDAVFGDSGGMDPSDTGDFDAETDETLETAYFRIPCSTPSDEWRIHHRTLSGACDVEDAGREPYALGVAHELRIVNARGLVLDATLWLPGDAFAGSGCPRLDDPAYADRERWRDCVSADNFAQRTFPGIVFSNGLSSRQEHYYWFAMRMAGEGYVVLTYDPAGQGESEGTWSDLLGSGDPNPACAYRYAGACRDLQDVTRWFTGMPVVRVADDGPRIAARRDPADNAFNPALPVLDRSAIALAGNSMGATTTLVYLNLLADGAGSDGRALPPVAAAVSLSGATVTRAIVPIQFQTSDYDGSPALVAPAVAGVQLGQNGEGIGYRPIKQRYDMLRASVDPRDAAPLSLVVLEGGVHTDHVNQPYVGRTRWANALAGDYAQDWLDCHVKGRASACANAISARDHLSPVFASEYDADGPDGAEPSRCIAAPDSAHLNQQPRDFVSAANGMPVYDCVAD